MPYFLPSTFKNFPKVNTQLEIRYNPQRLVWYLLLYYLTEILKLETYNRTKKQNRERAETKIWEETIKCFDVGKADGRKCNNQR